MSNSSLALQLRALTWVGAVLLLLMPVLTWSWRSDSWPGMRDTPGAGAGDWLVLMLMLPPFLLVAWGLLQLSGFCSKLARGDHLSRAAAVALRRFGWALVAAAVLLPVTRIAVRAYLLGGDNWASIAGGLFRTMPVLATAMGLIFGMIVVVFAAILEQATALAEENARFV